MDDLITWLKDCIDEDEKAATAIFRDHTWSAYLEGGDDGWAVEGAHSGEPSCMAGDEAMAAHMARHDPARVLREVQAKRRILDGPLTGSGPDQYTEWEWTLKVLALPYSDRPGYQDRWRP